MRVPTIAQGSWSWLWKNEFLSDLTVSLYEEEEGCGSVADEERSQPIACRSCASVTSPPATSCSIPCHALLLCHHSSVLHTLIQLHAAAAQSDTGVPPRALRLGVVPGKLAAAELLLEAIYDPSCLLRVLTRPAHEANPCIEERTATVATHARDRGGEYGVGATARTGGAPGSADGSRTAGSGRARTMGRVTPAMQPAMPSAHVLPVPQLRTATLTSRRSLWGASNPAVGGPPLRQSQPLRANPQASYETGAGPAGAEGELGRGLSVDASLPGQQGPGSCTRGEACGEAVVQAEGSDASPLQVLVDVTRLADQYQVDSVMQAAADVLLAARHGWSWQDVTAVLDLPQEALMTSSALLPLLQSARDAVWEAFEDLEAAWTDAAKRSMWLALPLCGVEWLLAHPGLKVRSENTVFVALSRWVETGAGARLPCTQLAPLLQLLQLPQCSTAFLLSEVLRRPWFRDASACATASASASPTTPRYQPANQPSAIARERAAGGNDRGGSGRAVAVGGSCVEDVLKAYLYHSSGMAALVQQCMPWQTFPVGDTGIHRRRRMLMPRCLSTTPVQLHTTVSMLQLEKLLEQLQVPAGSHRPGSQAQAATAAGMGAAMAGALPAVVGDHDGPAAAALQVAAVAAAAAAAGVAAAHTLHGALPAAEVTAVGAQPWALAGELSEESDDEASAEDPTSLAGIRALLQRCRRGRAPASTMVPQLLAASQPFYCCGYYWVLEVLMAGDSSDDCLVACLHATTPALGPRLPQAESPCSMGVVSDASQGVVVTALMQLAVWDHELQEWGLLYRDNLPARTGFNDAGAVRYTELYPIWSRSTLSKLFKPSAWQRRAYAPRGKLSFRAEILAVD